MTVNAMCLRWCTILYRVYGCVVRGKPLPNPLPRYVCEAHTYTHTLHGLYLAVVIIILYIYSHYAHASFFLCV